VSSFPFYASIPGAPIGKGRARAAVVGGHARLYTPKGTAEWERATAFILRSLWRKPPYDGPVEVRLLAVGPRPKRLMRKKDSVDLIWKPTKPDNDNIEKCTYDAIVMAGLIRDDCLIVKNDTQNCFTEIGGIPRIEIMIRPINCEPESFLPDDWQNGVNNDCKDNDDTEYGVDCF